VATQAARNQTAAGGPGRRQQRPAGISRQAALDQVENTNALQRRPWPCCADQPQPREIRLRPRASYNAPGGLRRSVAAITPRLELHDRIPRAGVDSSLTFLEQHADQGDDLCCPGAGHSRRCWNRGQRDQRARQNGALPPPKAQATPQPLELRHPRGPAGAGGRNISQNDWISAQPRPPRDLWFHAQEWPGAAIVILKSSEAPAGEQDLQPPLTWPPTSAGGPRQPARAVVMGAQ